MADADWKKRIGIDITYSSSDEEAQEWWIICSSIITWKVLIETTPKTVVIRSEAKLWSRFSVHVQQIVVHFCQHKQFAAFVSGKKMRSTVQCGAFLPMQQYFEITSIRVDYKFFVITWHVIIGIESIVLMQTHCNIACMALAHVRLCARF